MTKPSKKLKSLGNPHKEDVEAVLKEAMDKSQNGGVFSVMIGLECRDGCSWMFGGRDRSPIEIVGHLEYAKHGFLDEIIKTNQ